MKIGSELKQTFVNKNINAVNQGVTEHNVIKSSRNDIERFCEAFGKRSVAIWRSRGVRKKVVDGESGIMYQAQMATNKEGNPSIRNSALQGVMTWDFWLSNTMPHARELAKELASGAAEIKMPTRYASSSGRKN